MADTDKLPLDPAMKKAREIAKDIPNWIQAVSPEPNTSQASAPDEKSK